MKERPIIFSSPMVRAILGNRKTQTRRDAKYQEYPGIDWKYTSKHAGSADYLCPYGIPGDRLWVRETYRVCDVDDCTCYDPCGFCLINKPMYRADSDYDDDRKWKSPIFMPRKLSRITLEITNIRVERLQKISEEDAIAEGATWTDNGPRKWANPNQSFEELRGVNGWNEGWSHSGETKQERCLSSAKMSYANLWEQINGKGSWDLNPWVWVIEFRRVL